MARAAHKTSGPNTCKAAVVQDELAIDDDADNAGCKATRLLQRRVVLDGLRIEQHQIRITTQRDPTTVVELEALRWQAGDTADGCSESDDPSLAHVVPQKPCKTAASARMGAVVTPLIPLRQGLCV